MFKKRKQKKCELMAHITGELIPIENVKDQVFSTKMMGEGIAIIAKEINLCAPCNGEISLIAPTKHAIIIQNDDGLQILLHIGLDSANYLDSLFTVHVCQGDKVSVGDLLITINQEYLNSLDELVVPMVLLENPSECKIVIKKILNKVESGKDAVINY
ncbi:hypothetical protein AOC36_03045 [Erysipelothrix larvae]|uniref:PTS EIIA type-1 domain-containing protein n=1 Tax=Erysipelothrix larvae TaxID=1514105 RepID=A0A0X8GYY3_9FIRM|nr:glucose PTS transporter subunit IIA [Erysipelothrix larvae]AMC92994.1 hypothetical protein AOC36_03045 [Erysipelothrix larvae]